MATSLHTWSYASGANEDAAENAAELVNAYFDRNKECFVIVRQWPNMDAKQADDFALGSINSLKSVSSFDGPKADGQVYTVVYTGHRPEIIGQGDTRAVTVRQRLTKATGGSGDYDEDLIPATI